MALDLGQFHGAELFLDAGIVFTDVGAMAPFTYDDFWLGFSFEELSEQGARLVIVCPFRLASYMPSACSAGQDS